MSGELKRSNNQRQKKAKLGRIRGLSGVKTFPEKKNVGRNSKPASQSAGGNRDRKLRVEVSFKNN